MNLELRTKWIEALRNGEYSQGMGALERRYPSGKVRHCCLGVLCRIAGVPEGEKIANLDCDLVAYDGLNATLTKNLREQFGLDQEKLTMLISMNDSGLDFPRIAEYIEMNI